MDLFFQLLLGAFLGAVSGYYTNTIALKKLFSNNGIIARKRDNFIDEISKMVSKKIINYDSIFREIKKDKFKNNIKKFFKNLKLNLISKTSLKIKNIDGFNETKKNVLDWTKLNTKESVSVLLEIIFKNIKLYEIADDSQAKHIIESLMNSFFKYINDNNTINAVINDAYSKNNEKYNNILKEIIDNILYPCKNNNAFLSFIKSLIKYSNLENCFHNLLSSLSSYSIKELFSIYEPSEVKNIINKLLENKEFENIIKDIIEELYNRFKNTDKTIYELLNSNMSYRLNTILSDILPKFIDIIIPIINENKSKLDIIIEEAVDEEIDKIDGLFLHTIIKLIRNIFLNDIAAKYKIIEKVIEYIEKYKDNIDEPASVITNDIMNYLANTKISAVLNNADNIDNIKDMAKDIIIFNIKEIPDSWINNFLNMKLNVSADSNTINNLYNFLQKEIINYASLNSDKIINKLNTLLSKKIDTILLLKDNGMMINSIIENNRESIENYIYNIYCKYKDYAVYDLLNNFDSVIELSFLLFEEFIDKYCSLNMNELIIKKENQIDEFIDNNSYNSIINFISKEKIFISNIIDSLVIKIIKNNMGKLSKDEVAKMADDFMGKELEPINILGAFLGALFGLLSSYFFPINSFNSSFGLLNYIIDPLVYLFIGLLTNIIAIYSIFQPYEPLFGIKKKVFWGAVACDKNRFAYSMSNFVNDRLMEKEGLLSILDNKDDIENNLIKDNYKIFFNYMIEDDKITKLNIFSYIKNNLNNIILNNTYNIKYNAVNFFIKKDYFNFIKDNNKIKNTLISYINNNTDNIFIIIIKYILKNTDFMPLKEFSKNIVRDNLKDLNRFRDDIVINIVKAFNSNSFRDIIFNIVIDFLDNEISKNRSKKIKEMFNGEIVNLIRANNEFIFSMMKNKLNESLNNNRDEISKMIIENIPIKNNFVKDLTDKIVFNLINNKLPMFADDIKSNIINISFDFLDDNILSKDISYIFGNDKLYEESSLRSYLYDIIDNNQSLIYKVFDNIFALFVNCIDYKLLDKYIDAFFKNTDDDLYNFFKYIFISINDNNEHISIEIKNYIDKNLHPLKIKDCINIEKYFDSIFNDILKYSKNSFDNLLLSSFKDHNIIDNNNLIRNVFLLLETLEYNEYVNECIYREFKKILSKLRHDIPFIIDNKTKYYFLNLIINCAKDDINLIIDSIDFSAITKEEIDNMNPKNIHDVFNSFAKDYLNRLKLYGMFSAVVGIFLIIIKYISTFNSDLSNILNIILIVCTVILSVSMIISILKNIKN
ncbi:hypothetical protein [uncultured Brachyspira sp.]|uniref:hypothetical protein n=4 Tax=uncultured Brachyspira sp. TaxID=221953 RepID=UPI0025FEC346|nr:hypothetical protein [uncultured Brachyspira sp.]